MKYKDKKYEDTRKIISVSSWPSRGHSGYISFMLPVASGNSYGWEITEISMHN